MINAEKKEIISFRKSCSADGTGLSHYIVIDSGKYTETVLNGK